MDFMRRKPRKTPIGVLRDVLQIWAQLNGWKQATMVANLVDAHYRAGFDLVSGISFARDGEPSRDMKTNTERVMRWLDDQTKDSTLLPFNFYPSILAALPADLRQQLALELHEGHDLTVCLAPVANDADFKSAVHAVVKEAGEASAVLVSLGIETSAKAKHDSLTEIDEAIVALQTARAIVAARAVSGD